MDCLKLNKNICRICLDDNAVLNWNEEVHEFDDMTYKDCYYKYTQLEMLDQDAYSEMLCETCTEDLKTSHILIQKALESYAILQQAYLKDTEMQSKNCEEIESPILQKINKTKDEQYEFEILTVEIQNEPPIKKKSNQNKGKRRSVRKKKKSSLATEEIHNEKDKDKTLKRETPSKHKGLQKPDTNVSSDNSPSSKKVANSGRKRSNIKLLCSICSRIFRGKSALLRHEESHKEHRERSEVCPHCGTKFYDKLCLSIHLKTHSTNRKKLQCEFCDKSYYDRGTLNVHRRVHLGQMIPCSICSKEFYRQSELDRHNLVVHATAPISSDAKKRSRYYVFCKECNKQMLSTSWRAHQANHQKDPLLKCTLCDKDFLNRNTCRYHMKKFHNYKEREEYEQFITYYKTNRLSHLLLKQSDIIAT